MRELSSIVWLIACGLFLTGCGDHSLPIHDSMSYSKLIRKPRTHSGRSNMFYAGRALLIQLVLIALILGASSCTEKGPFREISQVRVGVAYDVAIQGNHAYVTNNDGVVIIDIHDRMKPRKLVTFRTNDGAFGVEVRDNTALLGAADSGLILIDITDPSTPKKLGVYEENGDATDLCTSQTRAHVIFGMRRLLILDIQNPRSPTLLGVYEDGGRMIGVECLDDVVYVAEPSQGLKVIDVRDPTSPAKVTTVPGTLGAWKPRVAGQRLFLACHENGVKILDISNPRSPTAISSFSLSDGGEALGTAGSESAFYIADGQNGIRAVDVTDPKNPFEKACARRYGPHSVSEDGEYIYVADVRKGFVILKYFGANANE